MHAVVAGFSLRDGYLFKCPVCGVILEDRQWFCPKCNAVIETCRSDMVTIVEHPKVCLDMHGVCLDMCGALRDYFADRGREFRPDDVTDYDFNCDTGIPQKDVFQAFKDPVLYDYVKPYEGVDKAVALLRTRVTPKVYSTSVDDLSIMTKTLSLIQDFGLYGQMLTGKKPVIYDAQVMFDDCAAVHRQWSEAGFKGLQYIIDRPYNQMKRGDTHLSRAIRVNTLYDGVVDMFNRYGWPIPKEV